MRSVSFVLNFDSEPFAEIGCSNRDLTEPLFRGDTVFDGIFDDRLEQERGYPSVPDAVVDRGLNGESFVPETRPFDREIRTGVFDLVHHGCVVRVM